MIKKHFIWNLDEYIQCCFELNKQQQENQQQK